jgi:nucleoside-diphosphate-sugar epimerase
MRVLIVGCGYVGVTLGTELTRLGHDVFGLRRSASQSGELKAAGIQPLTGDLTSRTDLDALPGPFDWVVNTAATSGGGEEDYRRTYLEGTRCLVEWLAGGPLRKYVYTSSTGVYGQDDGSLVNESSPTEPATPTARVLVETEQCLLQAARERGFPAVILRVAGIYGPGRGHYLKQYLRNEARLDGDGSRLLNMIHRDDVAGCIVAALQSGRPGQVYNAVDDEPVMQRRFFQWLSEVVGKYMPPAAAPGDPAAGKGRGGNKKVSNRRLRMELGYRFKYPTFRDGYTAEIARLQAADDFEVQPDPR